MRKVIATAELAILMLSGCGGGGPDLTFSRSSPVQFVDATEEAGVGFRHFNGASGRMYHPETHGGGAAWLDYDRDGYLDLYVVNSGALPGLRYEIPPTNVLYRNNGDGTFTEVTTSAGVADSSYGIGCVSADYNNDGYPDLYVTNLGPNVLYRNNGDGTFTNVAEAAGVAEDGLGISAAFLDYDADGHLDLYVVNYVDRSIEENKWCGKGGVRLRCDPNAFDARPDRLYRSNGDGTFTDVTRAAGVYNRIEGRGLGVTCGDYNNDGYVDIYVANDECPNFLYRNNGDGTFTDVALRAGVAYNEDGEVEAGMGTDVGDYDNDGDLDILVCHFQSESNTLYRNEGNGSFSDVTFPAGLGVESLNYLTFGTNFFDYDNDGHLDIFAANGHVDADISDYDPIVSYPQTNQLFRNNGDGTFTDVSARSGAPFSVPNVSRGAAFGDYDNDGDVDIYVVNSNQRAVLLRNDGGNRNHWLGLQLVGTQSNRDGIGARIWVTSGDLYQMEEARAASSYASGSDLRVYFGLGSRTKADTVKIRWPSGMVQILRDVAAGQVLTVEEHKAAEEGVRK